MSVAFKDDAAAAQTTTNISDVSDRKANRSLLPVNQSFFDPPLIL